MARKKKAGRYDEFEHKMALQKHAQIGGYKKVESAKLHKPVEPKEWQIKKGGEKKAKKQGKKGQKSPKMAQKWDNGHRNKSLHKLPFLATER